MRKIPFKVSAKTARLFGRENVSNAEGAIAELVTVRDHRLRHGAKCM